MQVRDSMMQGLAPSSATSRIFIQSQLDSAEHAAQVASLKRTCMRGLRDHVSFTKPSNYKLRFEGGAPHQFSLCTHRTME